MVPYEYMKNFLKHPIKFLKARLLWFVVGSVLAASVGYAATLWIVPLLGGSSGQGQSTTPVGISIVAEAVPSPTNLLYPGGSGDVVAIITNTNVGAVTITALTLPANTAFGAGYSDSTLTTPVAGCTATSSTVTYAFSGAGGSHTLTSALTVAGNSTLTVTFTNDAVMGLTAPAACEGTFFSLPSFTGVTATEGAATATVSPATDAWTS